eukprot:10798769-Ditylum_brightwellii.AAC.1
MKFKHQHDNPDNGNDFISCCSSPSRALRHRQVKDFCSPRPEAEHPSEKSYPNFKIDQFLEHIQELSMKAWVLRKELSVDEQTIGFQDNHINKLCITYKTEGNGIQCDALC